MRVEKYPLIFSNGNVFTTTQIHFFAVEPKLNHLSKEEYHAIIDLAQNGTSIPEALKQKLSTPQVRRPIIDNTTGKFIQEDYRKITLWHYDNKNNNKPKKKESSRPRPIGGCIGL
jgi:hypothetical protein